MYGSYLSYVGDKAKKPFIFSHLRQSKQKQKQNKNNNKGLRPKNCCCFKEKVNVNTDNHPCRQGKPEPDFTTIQPHSGDQEG
jgi:hypothetical protein